MDKKFVLLFIVPFVVLSGCQSPKDNFLAEDLPEISFVEMNNELSCLYFDPHYDRPLLEAGFVAADETKYRTLSSYIRRDNNPNCENFSLPSIDFSKYTLLAKYVSGGTCTTGEFERKLYRDDNNKKVIYKIAAIGEGYCQKLFFNYNWIKAEKFPSDYQVEFQERNFKK